MSGVSLGSAPTNQRKKWTSFNATTAPIACENARLRHSILSFAYELSPPSTTERNESDPPYPLLLRHPLLGRTPSRAICDLRLRKAQDGYRHRLGQLQTLLQNPPNPHSEMSTPPSLRSLCESAKPGRFVASGSGLSKQWTDTPEAKAARDELALRVRPETMLKVLDALEQIKDNCESAYAHRVSAITTLQSINEALNLLNGSTPETR